MYKSSLNQTPHAEKHQQQDVTVFGVWQYIMTDCFLFSALFATFIVLRSGVGVTPYPFDLSLVLKETIILLTSSFTFGLAMLYAHRNKVNVALLWIIVTFLLGLSFLYIEVHEFSALLNEGISWSTNGYFSAYFVLVGTHGLHVAAGLYWMILLVIQIKSRGINVETKRKLTSLSLFWHFLDIIWVFIFSIVYLIGAI